MLTVGLPDVVAPGKTVTLVFDYTGPISNEDDSPTRGVRFASVDKTGAYLLLPARWFPLTNYPSNRYTGTFKITVPDNFAVVGTGKADPPNYDAGYRQRRARSGIVRLPLPARCTGRDFRRRHLAAFASANGRLQCLGLHAAGAGEYRQFLRHLARAHLELFF